MELANTIIRILAASQVMLFIGVLFLSKNPRHVRTIGVTLMAAIVVFFFAPLITLHINVRTASLIFTFPSLVPALTLLFVWAVFEEGCTIPRWLIGLLCVDIAFTFLSFFTQNSYAELEVVSQLVKIFAATCSIYIVWKGREHDLVEMRLKIRLVFVSALTVTVLGVSIAEIFRIYNIDLPGRLLGNIWMLGITFLGNLGFIMLNPSLNLVGDPKELVVSEEPSDPIIDNLLQKMREERLYADHDLRVGTLADLISLPEYQLRKKINQNLGYRNFNQFVNRYRIEEAGERLLSELRTPVLSIALDVGFRSISSFNTAFQSQFGISPTKYRAQALSNS